MSINLTCPIWEFLTWEHLPEMLFMDTADIPPDLRLFKTYFSGFPLFRIHTLWKLFTVAWVIFGGVLKNILCCSNIYWLGSILIRLAFSRFLDLHGNLGIVKQKATRKTCFSREKKRIAPRIYQAKFCLAAFLWN